MNDPLAPLRARFLARCGDDLALLRGGPEAPGAAACVHRLAGTAGTFGYAAVSRLAAEVDDQLHRGARPAQAAWDALLDGLESLTRHA